MEGNKERDEKEQSLNVEVEIGAAIRECVNLVSLYQQVLSSTQKLEIRLTNPNFLFIYPDLTHIGIAGNTRNHTICV